MKLINTKFRPLRPLKPSVYMYFFFGGFCLMREAGGGDWKQVVLGLR